MPAVVTRLHGRDTGVGHHDVEAAELVDTRLNSGRQRGAVADIGLLGDDPRSGVLDEFDGGGQIIGGRQRIGHAGDRRADVDPDDVGALGCQPDRVGAALPAGNAGDQRDFAGQWAWVHRRICPLSGSPAGTGCSILMSGAPARCSPAALNILATAGALL